jgi:uncharacterized protein involved in exopolysaccharide biosynthesis
MTRIFFLRLLESYFRHRWIYLAPVVITIAAAGIYFLTYIPKFTAGGILYVNDKSLLTSLSSVPNNDTSWWLTPAQATSNEMNELLQTNAFVRAIISETDLEAYMTGNQGQVYEVISAVRKSLALYPVGANEISIYATFDDPQVSYQLVHSLINSYIRWQVNTRRVDSQVAQDFFSGQIESHGKELEAARQNLRDYYAQYPPPVRGERPIGQQLDIERLQAEIALVSGRYEIALRKEEEAKLARTQIDSEVHQTYMLLDAPLLPEKSDLSKRKLAVQGSIFLATGLLISLIGILGGTVLDRTFRFPADVQSRLNLPILAVIAAPPAKHMHFHRLRLPHLVRRKAATENVIEVDISENVQSEDERKRVDKPVDVSV